MPMLANLKDTPHNEAIFKEYTMGIFRHKETEPAGERLPEFIPATCIGESCPNFNGTNCDNPEMEWMTADGPAEKRDTSKPPLRDEATYIIYGQRCLVGAVPELVAQRVVVLKPEAVSTMMLIAVTGRYGDMPVQIVNGDSVSSVETVASSE